MNPQCKTFSIVTAIRLALVLLLVAGWGSRMKTPAQNTHEQTQQVEQAKPDQFRAKSHIQPGYKIISGDIEIPLNAAPESSFERNLWPGGVVFYEFDSNVTEANRSEMRAAMNLWTPGNSLVFREGRGRFGLFDIYIHIQNATGNSSRLGMILGGQNMNISSWGSRFIIAHEVGHALGLHHEHERPDRDLFVAIRPGNVQPGRENQFTLLPNGTPIYGPYDFDSLMHYDRCSFSTACPPGATCNCTVAQETIQVLGSNNAIWQSKIGQRDHISYIDGITISFLYPRGDVRFADITNNGPQDGSFLQPYQLLSTAVGATPNRGTVWIQPGLYRNVRMLSKPMTLRAPLGGVTIQPIQGVAGDPTLASVSAASYNGELAADSIAAAFGANLSAGVAVAASLPLPTTLGGARVKVKDAAGTERDAPLFFVSPNQINYQIPTGTSVGVASIAVYNSGGSLVANGTTPITAAAPALFAANANGEGVPAALVLRVRGSELLYEPVARYDGQLQRYVPAPIEMGSESDQVFLILFGTGFRTAGAANARVIIGEAEAEVLYAGAAPGFAGLDQANVRIPRSLAGKGEATIQLTADNRSANAVTVSIR